MLQNAIHTDRHFAASPEIFRSRSIHHRSVQNPFSIPKIYKYWFSSTFTASGPSIVKNRTPFSQKGSSSIPSLTMEYPFPSQAHRQLLHPCSQWRCGQQLLLSRRTRLRSIPVPDWRISGKPHAALQKAGSHIFSQNQVPYKRRRFSPYRLWEFQYAEVRCRYPEFFSFPFVSSSFLSVAVNRYIPHLYG